MVPRPSADRRIDNVPGGDVDRSPPNSTVFRVFSRQQQKSLEDAGLTETEVGGLILKFLLRRGVQSGRGIAEQLRPAISRIGDLPGDEELAANRDRTKRVGLGLRVFTQGKAYFLRVGRKRVVVQDDL